MVHQAAAKARMSGSLRTGTSIELPSNDSGRNLRTLCAVRFTGRFTNNSIRDAVAGNSASAALS